MQDDNGGISIATVCGSVRPGNYTTKVLDLVIDELARTPEITVDAIDPATLSLGFPGLGEVSPQLEEARGLVDGATGLILATPGYHGSYSSVIKSFIDNLGFPSKMAGKPVALLGVAAGQIGAVKALEHLRSVCSHVGAIVLPGPVSVADVQEAFDENGRCLDEDLERRIRDLATYLLDYVHQSVCPSICLEAMVRVGASQD